MCKTLSSTQSFVIWINFTGTRGGKSKNIGWTQFIHVLMMQTENCIKKTFVTSLRKLLELILFFTIDKTSEYLDRSENWGGYLWEIYSWNLFPKNCVDKVAEFHTWPKHKL